MSSPITQLQKSIRGLTTAIHLIQIQYDATDIPIQAWPSNSRALSKAYNRLAILLTQGSEVDNAARRCVAVTGGSSGSGLSISVLEEVDGPDQLPESLSASSDEARLDVQEIQPSTKTLDELADPSKHILTQQVSLAEHTSDLFKALIDYSKDGGLKKFLQFVWLRCHRRIRHRLAMDEVILGKPLYALLEEWKPAERDVVEDQWFDVDPRTHPLFDSVDIPSRPHDEKKRQYQFSRATVPAWCRVFISVLKALKDRAMNCDMQTESIMELNVAFFTLNLLLYKNDVLQTLLALPSLHTTVYCAMVAAERGRGLQRPESFDVHPLDDGDNLDDPATSPVLRYCKGVVAWLRAGMSLSLSKLLRGPLPKLYVISSHVPADKSSMVSLRDLMMDVILPEVGYFRRVDNKVLIQELLDREDFVNSTEFTGKVHCEATLIALANSFTPPAPALPFSEQTTRELVPLFSNPDRVVGLGSKSCFCCYSVAQLLRNVPIMPGTHGIIFPWTPPAFGIPVSVLEQLEETLVQKLIMLTETWIGNHRMIWSQASDSDDEDFANIPLRHLKLACK